MIWVLERGVFDDDKAFASAARDAGHLVRWWDDDWLTSKKWPRLEDEVVGFHGSLGNAAFVQSEIDCKPGAWCDVDRFCCSAWYPAAKSWLVHRTWEILPASEFVADPDRIFKSIGAEEACFVRPDSPLKPFSGRVLQRDRISLEALDHGFYFDDDNLPIVVAPVQAISQEWRFVVVDQRVVASSGYDAESRSTTDDARIAPAQGFAEEIASELPAPDAVYALDICECNGEFKLLELNPFGGADLYGCDLTSIIDAIDRAN
ncbi:MAG: ATP-grasp domain-containing protein [Planctomycetota bacterium]